MRKLIHRKVYGGRTYSEAMRRAFGVGRSSWVWIDGAKGKFPKNFSRFRAIVMGGSVEDPVRGREKPWMKKVYKAIRQAVREGIPILGICGGLQFVVRALGGEIVVNPRGREFGNVKINLTPAGRRDPLFRGFGKSFIIQSSHKCMARRPLVGSRLLATSPSCRVQVLAIGDKIRLVQFHPEMKASYIKAIARLRKDTLLQENFVRNERDFVRFLRSVKSRDRVGRRILRNFLDYFVP